LLQSTSAGNSGRGRATCDHFRPLKKLNVLVLMSTDSAKFCAEPTTRKGLTLKGAGLRDWLERFNFSTPQLIKCLQVSPCPKKIGRYCLPQWPRGQHISSAETFGILGPISARKSKAFGL